MLQDLKEMEKDTIELKSSFSDMDGIGRTMAGFSTKKGGKIYIGVDDNGCPIGVRCNKNIKDSLITLSRTVSPSAIISTNLIDHDLKKGLHIVCIKVEKGQGIYSYKKVPYQRREGVNHPLNPEEVFEIQKNIKKVYFDDLPATCQERPALITDIDENKVKHFLQFVKGVTNQKVELKRFLQNNNLIHNGSGVQVKNSAIMIFGKNVSNFIPQNKISLCEFPSTDITEKFSKTELEGDLIDLHQRAILEIEKRMKVYSIVRDYQRIDIPEYPSEAIREIITNAIVHRDYFDDTEIFIKIFKDRIEILNPASFPFENYTWEEIEKSGISKRRNPTVADFFEKYTLMEKEGRGISRIKSTLQSHGLPKPIIEVGQKTFKIIIYNSGNYAVSSLKSPYNRIIDAKNLNERQTKFLQYAQKNKTGNISRAEYVTITSTIAKTASRDLDDLVKRGFLKRFGFKRATRYNIIWEG